MKLPVKYSLEICEQILKKTVYFFGFTKKDLF